MDKIDRLINRAKPEPSLSEMLCIDNPYLEKSCEELLDYLSGENYRAPDMKTREWDKFMHALIHAESKNGLID